MIGLADQFNQELRRRASGPRRYRRVRRYSRAELVSAFNRGMARRYDRKKSAKGQDSLFGGNQKTFEWITIGGDADPNTGAKHAGGTPVMINKSGDIVGGPNRRGSLTRRFSRTLRNRMQGQPRRYDAGGGRWITLKGDSGKNKDGGTRVFLDSSGKIAKGPQSLRGKPIKSVDRNVSGTKQDKQKGNTPPKSESKGRRVKLRGVEGVSHVDIDKDRRITGGPKNLIGKKVQKVKKPSFRKNSVMANPGDQGAKRPSWMKKQPSESLSKGKDGKFRLRESDQEPRGVADDPGAEFNPRRDAEPPEQSQLPGATKPLNPLQRDDGKIVGAAQVHFSDLATDPARFQYKFEGIGEEGVTDELKGVREFNPMLGGQILAWHDPDDGKAYVVNGHHRHELARRSGEHSGWDGNMSTYFVDAGSAKEARALGALANIAEGRGTAVDAAKFLRDTGIDAEQLYGDHGISLKGAVARDAKTLTNLSDSIFQRLAEGMMTPGRALAIASELTDHDKQAELMGEIQKAENKRNRDLTDSAIREMAKMMDLASTSDQQGGLFDDFSEKSSFVERAELMAKLRRGLSSDQRTFQQASSTRRAEALESTGKNRLDVEGNRARAKAADVALWNFDTRANAKGDVIATTINDAAEELANAPRKRKSIEKRLQQDIRQILAGGSHESGSKAQRNARARRHRQPRRYARQRKRMIAELSRALERAAS